VRWGAGNVYWRENQYNIQLFIFHFIQQEQLYTKKPTQNSILMLDENVAVAMSIRCVPVTGVLALAILN
jgi:hypothetical protein